MKNMKNLTEDQVHEKLIDYVDGALSPEERASVEAFLKENPEQAELVALMRMAMPVTTDWHEAEPLRVSENFWPKLRDNLGPTPKRSAWSKFKNQLASVFGPSPATRLSLGAALAAIILALTAFWFAPQGSTPTAVAGGITAADMNFMKAAREKHEAYLRSQPAVPGDVASQETGGDDEDKNE